MQSRIQFIYKKQKNPNEYVYLRKGSYISSDYFFD